MQANHCEPRPPLRRADHITASRPSQQPASQQADTASWQLPPSISLATASLTASLAAASLAASLAASVTSFTAARLARRLPGSIPAVSFSFFGQHFAHLFRFLKPRTTLRVSSRRKKRAFQTPSGRDKIAQYRLGSLQL